MGAAILGTDSEGPGPAVPATAPSSLLTGLIAWWDLHEAQGTPRDDDTGLAPSLLETGGQVGSASGLLGNAAQFTGAGTNYLSATWTPSQASAFSLSAWVKPATILTNNYVLSITSANGATIYAGLAYALASSNGIFRVSGGNVAPANGISSGWNHMVGIYDGVNAKYYWNGALLASAAKTGADLSNAALVCVGAQGSTSALSGLAQLCGVWNRALSDGEIAQLYNGGYGADYPFI